MREVLRLSFNTVKTLLLSGVSDKASFHWKHLVLLTSFKSPHYFHASLMLCPSVKVIITDLSTSPKIYFTVS